MKYVKQMCRLFIVLLVVLACSCISVGSVAHAEDPSATGQSVDSTNPVADSTVNATVDALTAQAAAAGGIVLSNLPVPQKMMPGSVIIYDDQLQAKVIQGGYVKDDFTPISDTRTTILRGLEAVKITADMSPDERATAEWENRLVNGFKAQILKNGIQATQPSSPTIYPGMKVVYDENDGDINNIYYPDPKEPSGYSIHNVPVTNNDSTAITLTATPVLGVPYGEHRNVINYQSSDDSFLGLGKATYFTDYLGNRNNVLKDYDCATQRNLDSSKVGDKDVTIRNLNTQLAVTFYQADVGDLPDAVIDIWWLSNLHTLAGRNDVTSVYQVRYYHKSFSDQ